VHFGQRVAHHEPDIVPVEGVLRTRIAKADPELHAVPPEMFWARENRAALLRPGF
jgi:hypothetical protein